MQREGTFVNGIRSACHRVNLVLDLNQKVLKILTFLSFRSLYLSGFVLEPLLMYSFDVSILPLILIFHVYGRCGSSC